MKKYDYSEVKRNKAEATSYIEAVRRYLNSEKYPQVETMAAILGLVKEVKEDVDNEE